MGIKGRRMAVIRHELPLWPRSGAGRAAATRILLLNGLLIASALLAAVGDGPRRQPVAGGMHYPGLERPVDGRTQDTRRVREASTAPAFVISE